MTSDGQELVSEVELKEKIRLLKEKAKSLKLSEIMFRLYDWGSDFGQTHTDLVVVGKKICHARSQYYEKNKPKDLNSFSYDFGFWMKYQSNPDVKGFNDCRRMMINNRAFDFLFRKSSFLGVKKYGAFRLLVENKKVYEFALDGVIRKSGSSYWEINAEPDCFIHGEWVEDIISAFNIIHNEVELDKQRLNQEKNAVLKSEFGL